MYDELLDDNGRMLINNVCDASEQMEDLIEAILGLFSVTRSEMRAEKVNLSELAASVSVDLQMTAPERKVEFVIAQGLTASCDPDLMKVALENLLGNAWKYSRKTPDARIEFGVEQREGENVYYIRDNGAGFDMKDAAKLFTPFKRLHASRDFPGTGIGLATVQRIIERHGGRIWAEGRSTRAPPSFLPSRRNGHHHHHSIAGSHSPVHIKSIRHHSHPRKPFLSGAHNRYRCLLGRGCAHH